MDQIVNINTYAANLFSAYFGYGLSAGFMANRGFLGGNNSISSTAPENIDPITGAVKDTNSPNPWEGMSDEEKERESERLFVLFDRLNKTGVFQPINPLNLGGK